MRSILDQARKTTEEVVRALAAHVGDPVVSSVYLDVDGARRPVRAQVDGAFEVLADRLMARARAEEGRAFAEAVEGDCRRIRAWLGGGWERSDTRGLAFFSASRQGWFEVVAVAWPVPDAASLGARPRVTPLLAVLDAHRPLLVALVDRRRLRLFHLEDGETREMPGLNDPEPRAVDTDVELGGWAHQREEAGRVHYRRAAERIQTVLAAGIADRWVIGGPDEAVAGLEACLQPPAGHRLSGRMSVRVSAPAGEIAAAARQAERSVKLRRDADAVSTVAEEAGSGGSGSTGLGATLEALGDRRVATLLVAEGFTAPGARCGTCGRLGTDRDRCPRCGSTPVAVDDIVEAAVGEALSQRAAIEFIGAGRLDRLGKLASVNRFPLPGA